MTVDQEFSTQSVFECNLPSTDFPPRGLDSRAHIDPLHSQLFLIEMGYNSTSSTQKHGTGSET